MWGSIGTGLIRLLLLIDSVIYGFVADLFEIFTDLANASSKIFTDSAISSFANRIYVLVGVVALFIITYSLINAIVNPENLSKGNSSGAKLIMNLVSSIILVSLVPSIFNYAYKAQDVILNDNIIGKVFLGTFSDQQNLVNTETGEIIDDSYVVKQYGSQLSWSVLNAFFYTTDENLSVTWSPWGEYATISDGVSFVACGGALLLVVGSAVATYFSAGTAAGTIPTSVGVAVTACGISAVNDLVANTGHLITSDTLYWKGMVAVAQMGDFGLMTAFADAVSAGTVIYLPIISTIVGLVLLYMIFSYCLDLGLRAVKLAFYQMIAPIPIFSRIIPNNKIFNNWIKVTLTTFMEVFIRMVILFTVVFLASNIGELNIPGGTLVKMIIIMGIVTFAKQAPKLLSEITGIDSGNMKLGIMDKLNAGTFGLAGGVAGFATGALGGAIAAKRYGGSIMGGLASGAVGGFQGKGNQWKKQANKQYSALTGDHKGKVGIFGGKTIGTRITNKANDMNKRSQNIATVDRNKRIADNKESLKNIENEWANTNVMEKQRIADFEMSGEYQTAYNYVQSDEKVQNDIKKAQREWEIANAKKSTAADYEIKRDKAFKEISDTKLKEETRSYMRKYYSQGGAGYTDYKTDNNQTAQYLRDLDKNSIDEKQYNIKKQRVQQAIKKDEKIKEDLGQKQANDEWVKNMREMFKQTGLDKDFKKDDKK